MTRSPSPRGKSDAASPPAPDAPRISGISHAYSATSSAAAGDAGAPVAAVPERHCLWCESPLRSGQLRWCSKVCRQTAYRSRRISLIEDPGGAPKRLAVADPPYPGMSYRYYGDQPSYAGEVDHVELIAKLVTYDGWVLSTSAKTLRYVLGLCPPDVLIASWVKPNGVSSKTRGAHNCWEPIIYKPARRRRPGFRDWISAKPARGGGTLPGRKPIAYCAFVFKLLGASPGDDVDDLFPGTGIVGRTFEEFKRASPRTRQLWLSFEYSDAPSRGAGGVAVADGRQRRPEQLSTGETP